MNVEPAVVRMDAAWRGQKFAWKKTDTWMPLVQRWLSPRFRKDGLHRLRPGTFREVCWDDPEWGDILAMSLRGDFDSHVDELADSIENGTLRTFHGCRTDDAGLYFREGLRVHDRSTLTAKLRTIIEENPELDFMRDRMEAAIQEVNNVTDEGRLYVVADDTALLRFAAHYLIYGSEWIVAVLGEPGRRILRNVGVPTLLEIDLPLSMAGSGVRRELASKMLKEWARFACNTPDWSAPIDFSICLRSDIPASCIVGHTHPIELPDPLQGRSLYRPDATTCAYCG